MDTKLDKKSGTPLYLQIKERIKKSLPTDEQEEDVRIPSERQLADMFGVSRMTARQALKSLSEETALDRNEQGTFLSRANTKNLHTIRFVFPRNWADLSDNSFYGKIFAGAEQKSHEYDCDLLFSTIDNNKQLLDKIGPSEAVVLVAETNKKTINAFQGTGCLLCLVDCNVGTKNLGWDQVNIDNIQGSAIAADAFVNNNHKKCAYIAPYFKTPSFAFKQRQKGFADRLKEHGLKITDKDIFKMGWEDGDEINKPILKQIVDKGYTAVYASQAHFAVDLLQLAREGNVDDKISFIGFSDDNLTKNASLNTIDVPEMQIGEMAIEQLVKSYNNGWCLKQNASVSSNYIDRGSVHTL